MRGKVAIVVFILSALMVICQGEFPTRSTLYYRINNRALLLHVYHAKTTSSAVLCGIYCGMDPHCASFNYHESNHLCELNTVDRLMDACNFVEVQGSAYFDNNFGIPVSVPFHAKHQSCQMLLGAGYYDSGMYTIYPFGTSEGMQVYCDMTTAGGGWIVFQRRQDGSVDFYRNWTDYQSGFGNLCGEFWLGNAILRDLTTYGTFELRVDLEDWEGNTAWAEYGQFEIKGEKYTLNIGSYNAMSTAGNALAVHDSHHFTTKDQDNDVHSAGNCAHSGEGAWWFYSCYGRGSDLNGKYYNSSNEGDWLGVQWYTWKGGWYSLKKCNMKIREILLT